MNLDLVRNYNERLIKWRIGIFYHRIPFSEKDEQNLLKEGNELLAKTFISIEDDIDKYAHFLLLKDSIENWYTPQPATGPIIRCKPKLTEEEMNLAIERLRRL